MSGLARGWTVYVLRCADGSLYTGIARDLARRLAQHQAGRGARYTRGRLPVEVAWHRGRQTETDARRAEWALKQLPRAEKERLVAGELAVWRAVRRDLALRAITPRRPTAPPPRSRSPRTTSR